MKQLSSYMVLNVNGGDRVSFTYDEINEDNGELIRTNVKENFFVVDSGLRETIEDVRNWIRTHKLTE